VCTNFLFFYGEKGKRLDTKEIEEGRTYCFIQWGGGICRGKNHHCIHLIGKKEPLSKGEGPNTFCTNGDLKGRSHEKHKHTLLS